MRRLMTTATEWTSSLS